jgi:hypothetical protein
MEAYATSCHGNQAAYSRMVLGLSDPFPVVASRSFKSFLHPANQRHLIRDKRPSTAACPACWSIGTKKLKYFVLSRLEQPRQNKNHLHRQEKPNEPTKEGPLLFVLSVSPFTSVSTVSRSHSSVVSLLPKVEGGGE